MVPLYIPVVYSATLSGLSVEERIEHLRLLPKKRSILSLLHLLITYALAPMMLLWRAALYLVRWPYFHLISNERRPTMTDPVSPTSPALMQQLAVVVNALLLAEPQMVQLYTNVKNLENSALGSFIPANLKVVLDSPLLEQAITYLPKFVPFLQTIAAALPPSK